MYQAPIEVVKKSEEEFKKERHLPEGMGQRAVLESAGAQKREAAKNSVFASLRVKQSMEWSTEELLLLLLILWQLFSREHDYLLIGVLLFLLFFD